MQRLSSTLRYASCRSLPLSARMNIGRRFQSTDTSFREYFVIIWDRAEANRAQLLECDLKPPLYTFAGECLGKDSSGAQVVVGNAFACLAEDSKMVEEMIQSSVYNKQNIWDLKTADISPLLTVHSSDTSHTTAVGEVLEEPVPLKTHGKREVPVLEFA